MTPDELSALHARAMPPAAPWSAHSFAGLLRSPGTFLVQGPGGFALGRHAADEAELLTIAVDPPLQRAGAGRNLLLRFEAEARARGAAWAFLEVAADNTAALGLYRSSGWAETGRRVGYYARETGAPVDALVLAKALSAP